MTDTATDHSTDAAGAECCGPMPTTEAHERFAPFVGTFAAEVKMWMGPGEPAVSTGTMVNTLELGGRFLQQVYQGDANEGPFGDFAGRGYWGYNTVEKCYEGFWIDSVCTFFQVESGTVDASGTVWEMKGSMKSPQDGSTMAKRSVITLVNDNEHTMEMFFDFGGQEMKTMEIRYTRTA